MKFDKLKTLETLMKLVFINDGYDYSINNFKKSSNKLILNDEKIGNIYFALIDKEEWRVTSPWYAFVHPLFQEYLNCIYNSEFN